MMEIEVQEVFREMKRWSADNPNAPPVSIFRAEISQVHNQEVIANLPQKNDIIKTLNRV